ncbi:hypothetical protein P7G51_02585 [Enterococcus asini]|uniref:DUF4430 domain-containing protein n=1 Tax=Enterococcus asini TaxID=57732 RepID=UPI00288C9E5F|nr:DUF4430 domain-containing protein [Enterococcus asini]MDT2756270.1 hypothetical protein [Enterococcus asini]
MKKIVQGLAVTILMGQVLVNNGLAVYAAETSDSTTVSTTETASPESADTTTNATTSSSVVENAPAVNDRTQTPPATSDAVAPSQKVQELIDEIGRINLSALTPEDQTSINQLIDRYNQLTDEEKAQVTNGKTLQEAAESLQKLLAEAKSTETKTITISVEKFVLGQGYVMEPMEVQLTTEMNYAQVLDDVFAKQGLQYSHTGTVGSNFYLSGIENADNGQTKVPQELIDFSGNDALKNATNQFGSTLREFSYTPMSGWLYSVNNDFPGVGMGSKKPEDGDVFRVQFSLVGYGADLGNGGTGTFAIADKLALTKKIGEINQDAAAWQAQGTAYQAAYQFAMTQLTDLTASQALVDQALAGLDNPATTPEKDPVEAVKQLIQNLGEIHDLAQKQQVQEARSAYDALTKEEQAQVGKELVAQLVAAEKQIAQLEDQKAADEVTDAIAALPAIDQLQLSDQGKVAAAKKAYDTLTAMQKKLVSNYATLEAAIKQMAQLQSNQDVVAALKRTSQNIESRGSIGEWSALAMSRSGYPASEAMREATYKTLAEQILRVNGNYGSHSGQVPWTDAQRQVIGILSLGGDPTNISGFNLIKLLVEEDITGTINNQIFGLIALSSKDYQLKGQSEQIKNLIDLLVKAQLKDGGWALYGNDGDIDLTGMALSALAPYKEQKAVATAIEQGIGFLKTNLTADGDFYVERWYSEGPNTNSQAQAILGLAACGEDVTSKTYTNAEGKNPVMRLLEFQMEDGSFKYLMTDTESDPMATDQAAHGLSQFLFQQNNQGNIYDFAKNPVTALPQDENEVAAQKVTDLINALPAPADVTLDDQEAINKASSEYKLLSPEAKELLTSETLKKLQGCQERLYQLESDQQAVENVIQSLEYMKLLDQMNMWSLSYQTFVTNARQSYEALTANQKALISDELLAILNKAEKIMAQLKADEKAVKEITEAITALPEASELTMADIDQASAVATLYDGLRDELKDRLAAELVEKWQKVSQRLAELKADLAKAQAVMDQIKALPALAELSLKDRGQIDAIAENYEKLTQDQQALVENYATLTKAQKRMEELMTQQASYEKVLQETNQYVLSLFTNYQPDFNNEWLIMDLARNGYDLNNPLFKTYYENVVSHIQEVKGELHRAKYTEYSRLALALTAIGKDAQDVGGYNLFDYLSDFKKVTYQGVNGAIFALIAVDSRKDYQFTKPAGVSEYTTREKLIDFLLQKELKNGGWNLFGDEISIDLTGMALQALAPYQSDSRVAAATQRGLTALSNEQNENGTFGDSSTENVEEVVQVITALTALGINPTEDQRFVKKYDLLTALKSFHVAGSGFMHVLPGGESNGGGAPGEVDGMATEQGMYALIAYDRFLQDKNALYDMNDVPVAADQDAAKKVTEQIKALGTITSLDQRNAVASARLAYEGLSQKQQSLIEQTVYNQLLQAEKNIAQLVAAEEEKQTQAENQAAAGKVILAINKLPEPAFIQLQDEGQIALVRKAYNQLSHAAQSLVTNLDKLTAVEAALQHLKQADAVIVPKPVVDTPTSGSGKGNVPSIQVMNGGSGSHTGTTTRQNPQSLTNVSTNTQSGKPATTSKAATPKKTAEKKAADWQFEGETYEPATTSSQKKAQTKEKTTAQKVPVAVEVAGVVALGTAASATGFWFWKKRA